MRRALIVTALIVCGGSACLYLSRADEPAAEKPPLKKEFTERLLKIAQNYPLYFRADPRARIAPTGCGSPPAVPARTSAINDESTHGKKLYFLFVRGSGDYLKINPSAQDAEAKTQNKLPIPDDFVVVKEAWLPEKVAADTPQLPRSAKQDDGDVRPLRPEIPYAKSGDDLFHAKEKTGLFVMFKLAADTPETDQGWVYGTVSADGKTVTSAGKVQSCMECHEKATRDRLFGMKDIAK